MVRNISLERQEKKKDAFVKLANTRVNLILDTMDLLGNLANKNNYCYSNEQSRQIIDTIERKLKFVKSAFDGKVGIKKKFELL